MPFRVHAVGLAAALAAIVLGLAACGDDDSGDSTDTAGGTGASAEFCNSLDEFSTTIARLAALDAASVDQSEIDSLNISLEGATDDLNLAAQGAGVDVDALEQSIEDLMTTIDEAEGSPTEGAVEAVASVATSVEAEIRTVDERSCADVG